MRPPNLQILFGVKIQGKQTVHKRSTANILLNISSFLHRFVTFCHSSIPGLFVKNVGSKLANVRILIKKFRFLKTFRAKYKLDLAR
jgi:hypothetical protein